MKLHVPSYYEAFSCAAGACPDTCCQCWEVVVDDETRRRYLALPGPLGDRVRGALRQDGDGEWYLSFSGGGCPMLREDGLCALQRAFGETALSAVCNRYPRFRYEFGGLTESGVSLSCPEACRLILETPFSLSETVTDAPPSLNDIDPARFYTILRGRETAFSLAASPAFSVREKLALLLAFGEALEEGAAGNWLDEAALRARLSSLPVSPRCSFATLLRPYDSMEHLTERFPRLLRALPFAPSPLPAERETRLLQYFLYKYFLQAAYDGRLLEKLQFCAASLLVCGALCAAFPSETTAEQVDLLHLYSRETEHSEENLRRFWRWSGKKRQKLFYSLLLAQS